MFFACRQFCCPVYHRSKAFTNCVLCFSTKRFLRTIALPQWHFATSLSAHLLTTKQSLVAAGLSSGRLYVIDYHSEAVADIDPCTENGQINALSFCPNRSALFSLAFKYAILGYNINYALRGATLILTIEI